MRRIHLLDFRYMTRKDWEKQKGVRQKLHMEELTQSLYFLSEKIDGDPEASRDGCRDVLERYRVDYIYVSDYERSDFDVDTETIEENWPLVYENRDVRIYDARPDGLAAREREPS